MSNSAIEYLPKSIESNEIESSTFFKLLIKIPGGTNGEMRHYCGGLS